MATSIVSRSASLLTPAGYNPKTAKGLKYGVETAILHMAPARLSGRNVCPFASNGCTDACLNISGRGAMLIVQNARIRRTQLFFTDRHAFFAQLRSDIHAHIRRAQKLNRLSAIRLNGTSDLPWERIDTGSAVSIIEEFPGVEFYDYTKSPVRMRQYLAGAMPENYSLVYSRSEAPGSEDYAREFLAAGGNVAVVFLETLPATWNGYQVIDGDAHDLRFTERQPAGQPGVVVGLTAKGSAAKRDMSGFIVR